MIDIHQLRAIERECNVSYPVAFWAIADELVSLSSTSEFATCFPSVSTATQRDIQDLLELWGYKSLLPFMCEQHDTSADYYCCQSNGGPEVSVFSVHTTVADWPSFKCFVEWLRSKIAEQP